MKLLKTRQLNIHQLKQLKTLHTLCRNYEDIHLSCPSDGNLFYLLENSRGELESILCIYEDEELPEGRAFTSPHCRQQGYFRRLLDRLEEDMGDQQIIFSADPRSCDALKTLDAIGAQFWYEEYAMALKLENRPAPEKKLYPLNLQIVPDPAEANLFSVQADDGMAAGSCRLAQNGSSACLFSFEIQPERRGKGLGYSFLQHLMARLSLTGIGTLTLQVSSQNLGALALYKKTGFRIRDTLSYYLY